MNRRFLMVLCLSLITISQAKADAAGVFTYQNGSFTTIPNTALDTPLGIDSAGDLLLATDGNVFAPVLYSAGIFTSISVPGATTEAYSMSQNGTVLGQARAFFTYFNGSFTTINLSGFPRTTGNALINDQGQIIASSVDCCNQPDFIFNSKTSAITPVSFPGATSTSLIAINNNGQVLGFASGGTAGAVYFIYNNGAFAPLALGLPAGCAPDGINDSDEIIGNCVGTPFKGFLYNSGTTTFISFNGNANVNDTLISDINDSGEIVGTFSSVPESSTLSQLGIGLLFLAGMALRMRRIA